MCDETSDDYANQDSDSGRVDDENEISNTAASRNLKNIALEIPVSNIRTQMAANQAVLSQIANDGKFMEWATENRNTIKDIVDQSGFIEQLINTQKIFDQIATESKIQEQIAASQEVANGLTASSSAMERMTINQDMINQLAAGSNMMEQIQADQKRISQMMASSGFTNEMAANQRIINQLVTSPNLVEQLNITQDFIDQLQQPAIDPKLVSALDSIEIPPLSEFYEAAAALEQISQRPRDSPVDQEQLQNQNQPQSDGFLSLFFSLTARYLLNSDEDLSEETVASLNAVISAENVQIKTDEFNIIIVSLSQNGLLLLTTGFRYALLFASALYFPSSTAEDSSEIEE